MIAARVRRRLPRHPRRPQRLRVRQHSRAVRTGTPPAPQAATSSNGFGNITGLLGGGSTQHGGNSAQTPASAAGRGVRRRAAGGGEGRRAAGAGEAAAVGAGRAERHRYARPTRAPSATGAAGRGGESAHVRRAWACARGRTSWSRRAGVTFGAGRGASSVDGRCDWVARRAGQRCGREPSPRRGRDQRHEDQSDVDVRRSLRPGRGLPRRRRSGGAVSSRRRSRLARRAVPSSSSPLGCSGRCSRASAAKKSSERSAALRTSLNPPSTAKPQTDFPARLRTVHRAVGPRRRPAENPAVGLAVRGRIPAAPTSASA